MHAVVAKVTISDREAAESSVREEVVPQVSQIPGFVAGLLDAEGRHWTVDGRLRV
jgi:hypothetical protein